MECLSGSVGLCLYSLWLLMLFLTSMTVSLLVLKSMIVFIFAKHMFDFKSSQVMWLHIQ